MVTFGAILPREGDAPRRTRFVCEKVDRSPNPLLLAPWEPSERLHRSPGDLDFVSAHAQSQVRLDLVPGHVVVVVPRRIQLPPIVIWSAPP